MQLWFRSPAPTPSAASRASGLYSRRPSRADRTRTPPQRKSSLAASALRSCPHAPPLSYCAAPPPPLRSFCRRYTATWCSAALHPRRCASARAFALIDEISKDAIQTPAALVYRSSCTLRFWGPHLCAPCWALPPARIRCRRSCCCESCAITRVFCRRNGWKPLSCKIRQHELPIALWQLQV